MLVLFLLVCSCQLLESSLKWFTLINAGVVSAIVLILADVDIIEQRVQTLQLRTQQGLKKRLQMTVRQDGCYCVCSGCLR